MATMEEILRNNDARFYDGRDPTFDANNIFQSGFGQGANQNYGITGAPMYLDNPEEEFNAGTMYTTNPESSFTNASVLPNSNNPGFDNRFSGIMRNTVARPLMFQGGAQAGMGLSKAFGINNPFLALASGIGSQFLPLNNRPSNLDYDYVNQPGGVSVVDNKIRGGVLEGKNFASGFGSNNLGTMYQDYIDKMEEEEELTKGQTQKLKDARAELRSYLTTGPKMSGYETPEGKRMTNKEFAFNYNQGIGQFAQPDYDQLDSQDYTGGMDTTTGNYEDTYDPGTVD